EEQARGYDPVRTWFSGEAWRFQLERSRPGALIAAEASEPIDALDAEAEWDRERARRQGLLERAAPALRTGPAAELVLAADAFVTRPVGRGEAPRRTV